MAQEIINGEVVQTITIPLQEYITKKQNEIEVLRQESEVLRQESEVLRQGVEQKNLQIQEILEELRSLVK